MSNIAAIDAKFWATLVENPWTIVVHLLDIFNRSIFYLSFNKSFSGHEDYVLDPRCCLLHHFEICR